MGVASKIDRIVQFRRSVGEDDGLGGTTFEWQDHGDPIWAAREDVSDTETIAAGVFRSKLLARFTVRNSEFTSDLTTDDRIVSEGTTFAVVGIKEPKTGQRRQLIEITGESIVV